MKAAMHMRQKKGAAPRRVLNAGLAALLLAMLALPVTAALAGSREQAKRLHDRLNGAPPSQTVLDAMQAKIDGGDGKGAALLAIDNPNGNFYSIVLKNFVTPWTN